MVGLEIFEDPDIPSDKILVGTLFISSDDFKYDGLTV